MPKVSGLIVPKLCHTRHDGNIRCLEPVAPSAHHHDYGSGEYEGSPGQRRTRRTTGDSDRDNSHHTPCVVSEFFLFIDEHVIDLTNKFLHFVKHPFVFLVKFRPYVQHLGTHRTFIVKKRWSGLACRQSQNGSVISTFPLDKEMPSCF